MYKRQGNTNYGFGFSSSLTSDMEYADVPAPFYHWNLLVVSHEIGHNFGSMHTQWCGWSGGPLSNCVDLEESVPGECDPYVNNPAPSIGTIMSYCHTWSQSQGGGITMKFEQQVKDVIMNKAISMQLDVCEDEDQENEQIVAGCIDEIACNYNSLANQSDGSCTYSEEYYDCVDDFLTPMGPPVGYPLIEPTYDWENISKKYDSTFEKQMG